MRHYSGNDPDSTSWSEKRTVAKRILLFLIVAYFALTVGAHFLSHGMIFPRPPVSYELTPEYMQLTTPEGIKLAGRHWPNPDAKFTMLYLHGNYEDLGSIGDYVPEFISRGYAVFSIDYRNYGHSGGSPNETNTCADVRLAYNYLCEKLSIPAERIIIFGYSLGSGPAVELALHAPAAGLVLQGAYVSTYRTMTSLPLFPGDKFVNIRKVSRLTLPVFYIHGTDDGVVRFWHAEKLYAATKTRKSALFVPGGHHWGLAEFTGPRYWEELKKFADSL